MVIISFLSIEFGRRLGNPAVYMREAEDATWIRADAPVEGLTHETLELLKISGLAHPGDTLRGGADDVAKAGCVGKHRRIDRVPDLLRIGWCITDEPGQSVLKRLPGARPTVMSEGCFVPPQHWRETASQDMGPAR